MSETPLRGTAILRDFPLRLWARQQEHLDAVLREFQLLLVAESSPEPGHEPRQLVELADQMTTRFGPLLESIRAERQAALDRGLDRIDSVVPLPDDAPDLIDQIERVLASVDEFCRAGNLLVLPRSPEQLALSEWTRREVVAQYEGRPPTPWPGPF